MNVLDLAVALSDRPRGPLLGSKSQATLSGPVRPDIPVGQEARFANLLEWRVILGPAFAERQEVVALVLATPSGTITEWIPAPGVATEAARLAALLGGPSDGDR